MEGRSPQNSLGPQNPNQTFEEIPHPSFQPNGGEYYWKLLANELVQEIRERNCFTKF